MSADLRRSEREAIGGIARRQHGLVTAAQLAELGLSPRSIRRRVSTGGLVRAGIRVFATAGSPGCWEQSALAACLDLGPEAVLSHTSAATAWHLDVRPTSPVHVTVPYGRNARRRVTGVVVHRSYSIESTRIGALPTIGLTRTIVQLAGMLRVEPLSRVVDDALSRRLVRPEQLRAAVERHASSKRSGVAALRALVEPWLGNSVPESVAEARFLRALAAAGLPAPVVQHEITDAGGFVARVDLAWPDRMVVLEVDGFRWHADPRSHARDSQRSNRLAACGWTVLHATPAELDTAAAGVVAALRRKLEPAAPAGLCAASVSGSGPECDRFHSSLGGEGEQLQP